MVWDEAISLLVCGDHAVQPSDITLCGVEIMPVNHETSHCVDAEEKTYFFISSKSGFMPKTFCKIRHQAKTQGHIVSLTHVLL